MGVRLFRTDTSTQRIFTLAPRYELVYPSRLRIRGLSESDSFHHRHVIDIGLDGVGANPDRLSVLATYQVDGLYQVRTNSCRAPSCPAADLDQRVHEIIERWCSRKVAMQPDAFWITHRDIEASPFSYFTEQLVRGITPYLSPVGIRLAYITPTPAERRRVARYISESKQWPRPLVWRC